MEDRKIVVVPEKKERIAKIKQKYNNMSMSDNTADKIWKLQITNGILKAATAVVGVITAVDYFIPDPLLGLDEAALTAITGLLAGASKLVDNKIEDLANSDHTDLKMSEINDLSNKLGAVFDNVAKKKAASQAATK